MKCSSAFVCEWPHCECAEVKVWPWAAKKHGIARPEWERRFHAHVAECARDNDGGALLVDAVAELSAEEISVWPEAGDPHNGPDWMVTLPEEAADEQMSNWLQDQEP